MNVILRIWRAFLSFFGIHEKEREKEVMEDYRKRITKEKIAELARVIDGQVETLSALEERWQHTYESVEEFVKKRDERDADICKALEEVRKDAVTLVERNPAESDAARQRSRELLQMLYEESRFYVGMADSLNEMLSNHKKQIDALFSGARNAEQTLGRISGATLSAAMLSAKFGEDAAEFAAVCDTIREISSAASDELLNMRQNLSAEMDAYEDTFEQLANLTERLFKNRDMITALYETNKETANAKASDTAALCADMDEKIADLLERVEDAGAVSRRIEKETEKFRAVDEEEAKSRADIESVAEEIHLMITEA